jgi:hypothetical protein
MIAYFTTMKDYPMPYRYPITNIYAIAIRDTVMRMSDVQDAVILNIGVFTDTYFIDITTYNGKWPDRAVLSNMNVTQQQSGIINKCVLTDSWGDPLVTSNIHNLLFIRPADDE